MWCERELLASDGVPKYTPISPPQREPDTLQPPRSFSAPTILQIIPKLETGGAERTVVEMSAAITRAGGRALIAAAPGRMADAVRAAGGEIIDFPAATKNPFKILANAVRLVALIKRERIDLLHARSRAPAWSALIAARRSAIPFVTTYHGAYSEENALKKLYNSVMARADRVIANSDYTAALIRARYRTEAGRLTVIPRGVDPEVFDPAGIAPERIAKLRAAWGIGANDRVILHAARLTGWKGQRVVIDAAGRLGLAFPGAVSEIRPVAIVLAGDAQGRDGYVEELRSRIKQHRLGRVVRLVGHVDDMPAAFATAYVTLVPSTEPEAFGRAAIEAQAAGSPVIATRLGAPPETVRATPDVPAGEQTGWLVAPGDADALAGALSEALALSPAEHTAMATRARINAVTHFTLARLQSDTLAVYDALLGTQMADRFRAVSDA